MNIRVRLNIFKASSQPVLENDSECFFVEMIIEASHAILSKDPLGTCLSYGDLRLLDLGSTIDEMDSIPNSTSHFESCSWVSTYEPLPTSASSSMAHFVVFPPKLKLKPLPDSLKYVFLGPEETLLSLYLIFYFVIKRKS